MRELGDVELVLAALCFTKVGLLRFETSTLLSLILHGSRVLREMVYQHCAKSFLSGNEMNV